MRLITIPRLLHQTWKSKSGLPHNYAFWSRSFVACHPDLEHRIYDDADNRALLADTFPQLLPLYDAFPREIFRADFIRPVYLFRFGGMYADMDFQCLRPLDDVFASGAGVVLGRMGGDETFAHSIPNAMMFSAPGQAFWLGYLALMAQAWAEVEDRVYVRPENVTGPVVLREAVRRYREDPGAFRSMVADFIDGNGLPVEPSALEFGRLELLPGHLCYPLQWNVPEHQPFTRKGTSSDQRLYSRDEACGMFPDSLAVTWWTYSWGAEQPVRRRRRRRAWARLRDAIRSRLQWA